MPLKEVLLYLVMPMKGGTAIFGYANERGTAIIGYAAERGAAIFGYSHEGGTAIIDYHDVSITHRTVTWTTGSVTCVGDLFAYVRTRGPRFTVSSEGLTLYHTHALKSVMAVCMCSCEHTQLYDVFCVCM